VHISFRTLIWYNIDGDTRTGICRTVCAAGYLYMQCGGIQVTIEPTAAFNTISQRILYGLNFMYSEFVPVESEKADEQGQQKLHRLMGQMIDKLYETPELLNLPGNADEAYEWYALNNTNPELDKVYKSIFKCLFDFYQFLYISFLRGEASDKRLAVSSTVLKEHKASCKPLYKALLKEIGIGLEKGGTEILFIAENDIIQSLRLLAEKVPVNINPWTPYALIHFACCSFTGDFNFLLTRVDNAAGLNGLLLEIRNICLKSGYEKNIKCSFGASGFDFSITFHHTVGGFVFGYNPRKYRKFFFGSMNSIGVKAMLEDFENLDEDLRKHLISVCKTCNGCLGCTKGGRNEIFAVKVKHGGKEYTLCPDNYARHNWETINGDLAAALFKYHAAQEIYGSDWKKK
jgi:hypothetical protein